jgi:hypothetical protein
MDRIIYCNRDGDPVAEEYDRPCPICGARCNVFKLTDGTAGRERCTQCAYMTTWGDTEIKEANE